MTRPTVALARRAMWLCGPLMLLSSPLLRAQTTTSFAGLPALLKPGQTVVITSSDGVETKGVVAEVTPTALILRTPEARSFAENRVDRIRRTDSVWNGALIGAGIGGGIALAGFQSTRGESDAVYGWAYVGSWLAPAAGAIVGALTDRASGSPVVYKAPARASAATVAVSPLLVAGRTGAWVSITF